MRSLRQVWLFYVGTMVAILLLGAALEPHGVAIGRSLALHLGVAVAALLLPTDLRAAAAWWWAGFTALALPLAFAAPGLTLPELHPQAWEWRWLAVDRLLCDGDPTVLAQALIADRPLLVEVLQLSYATFYFLPAALLVALLRAGRLAAYVRVLRAVTLGFLLSYLGYYLFPTLPPYRYLTHDVALDGLFAAGAVRDLLDALEANRFDCFPSGHTMMTLVTLHLAWRERRGLFLWLLLPALPLILATVTLRYHYLIDVIAGALLWPLAIMLADRLGALDADGAQVSAQCSPSSL